MSVPRRLAVNQTAATILGTLSLKWAFARIEAVRLKASTAKKFRGLLR